MSIIEGIVGILLLFATTVIDDGLQALGEGIEAACLAGDGTYEMTSRDYDGQWECKDFVFVSPR